MIMRVYSDYREGMSTPSSSPERAPLPQRSCDWTADESRHKMATEVEIMVSQRGKPKLGYQGHVYVKDKLSKDGRTQFWRCQDVGSCKGRLHTSVESNEVLRIVGTHSDEPDPTNLEMCRKISSLKEMAMQSQETPLQLIESVFESTSQAAKLLAPSHDTLSKIVNRAKMKASRAPAVPKDRASIRVPENYATYETAEKSRENFLIGDSGKNSNCFTMESICSLKYFGGCNRFRSSEPLDHSFRFFYRRRRCTKDTRFRSSKFRRLDEVRLKAVR